MKKLFFTFVLYYVLFFASWCKVPFLIKTYQRDKYRYHYEYYIG